MASLMKIVKISQSIHKNPAVYLTAIRHHWNKDWKPGPYPRTPEQREAAAKKYGLHPSEYQPYPDDGFGYGDYPKLPDVGPESKDPNYPYDFPEFRRNFNEPIHVRENIYGMDRVDPAAKFIIPLNEMRLTFFVVMAGFFLLYFYLDDKKIYRPVMPRQYPGEERTHYTFETNE